MRIAWSFFVEQLMVYAEMKFIEGFLCELAVLLFVKKVCFLTIRKKTIVSIAFIFGIVAVFSPIFPLFCKSLKFLLCFVLSPILCKKKSIFVYFGTIVSELVFCYFVLPVPFSVACNVILICLGYFPKRPPVGSKKYYECVLSSKGKKVRTVAFFDSGNRVFGNNGEPVVWANGSIYNKLEGEESEVCYSTLTGVNIAPCKDCDVTVCYEEKSYSYSAKIARSPKKLLRCDVILHGDMTGGL